MMELHVCNRHGALLRSFVLGDRSEIIVGRDETCDVRIDARAVAPEHCLIEQRGDDVFVRDLGSGGGTFVGPRRVEDRTRVFDGTQVRVGPAILKFHDSGI